MDQSNSSTADCLENTWKIRVVMWVQFSAESLHFIHTHVCTCNDTGVISFINKFLSALLFSLSLCCRLSSPKNNNSNENNINSNDSSSRNQDLFKFLHFLQCYLFSLSPDVERGRGRGRRSEKQKNRQTDR